MADQEIAPLAYEETLNWFYEEGLSCAIQLKATCAPHYYRIFHQRQKERRGGRCGARCGRAHAARRGRGRPLHAMTRGCLGGSAFCFISHTGQVQPCGYLELDCGQITEADLRRSGMNRPYSGISGTSAATRASAAAASSSGFAGAAGRALSKSTGNYLAEEPLCVYEPRKRG